MEVIIYTHQADFPFSDVLRNVFNNILFQYLFVSMKICCTYAAQMNGRVSEYNKPFEMFDLLTQTIRTYFWISVDFCVFHNAMDRLIGLFKRLRVLIDESWRVLITYFFTICGNLARTHILDQRQPLCATYITSIYVLEADGGNVLNRLCSPTFSLLMLFFSHY